ncbi:MAG TPA: tRNA lysidine(34) synthetase TilS [Chitinophagales bacterium]|nr:tRNA lysidine(34) synthetase TilS [Chitinophagales bacterium]
MNKNKTLLQRFTEYNTAKRLANRKKKTLLTVSGGVDSVVMCHLFKAAGYPFAIAHCNFQLRGDESNGDEAFVKTLGDVYGVPVYVKQFDTKGYSESNGVSTQVAARELRYTWFEELRKEHGFNLIATAHHLNDSIETILFNLTKGTGIRGLRGIPQRQGNVIRPLLFASREDIATYLSEHNLQHREDSSNASDKYTRNKIRHQVIPLLKEINPALEDAFAGKIDLFTQLETLYDKQVQKETKRLFLKRGNDIYIPLAALRKSINAATVLFEYLKDYGFNTAQVDDLLAGIDSEAGKQYLTGTMRIIKDRRFYILTQLKEQHSAIHLLQANDKAVSTGTNRITHTACIPAADVKITADKNTALVDAALLKYPLTIRKWKQGDYFYPFGMKMKKKKLKKFLIDEKVPLNEKENVWVIESDKRIVWVAGYRIDERFKITPATKQLAKFTLH